MPASEDRGVPAPPGLRQARQQAPGRLPWLVSGPDQACASSVTAVDFGDLVRMRTMVRSFTDEPAANSSILPGSAPTPPLSGKTARPGGGSAMARSGRIDYSGRSAVSAAGNGAPRPGPLRAQAVSFSMRIGAVADPGEWPTGSTVRATQSPAARPVAMTGLVMPWSGAGSSASTCAGLRLHRHDQPRLAAFGQDLLVRARLWQPIQTQMFCIQ